MRREQQPSLSAATQTLNRHGHFGDVNVLEQTVWFYILYSAAW
ncbi:hypothetical protein [Acidocella aminolytica]|jgi:hypothetical protein|nr:hypothetical protein [Acidocella aminolytica]SHF47898.1 hypothetical protein SAMN02746095_03403 [Acidocella aminolytica 101 = DSM 11237]